MLKALKRLQDSLDFWVVLGTSLLFFLFRFPSFFEPYWYGDEGIYQVIGYALRHGRLLYVGIWDNKPPLLYLIYALVNGDQTGAKILSFFAGLGAVLVFFFLAKKLFTNRTIVYLTTAVFAVLFGLPLLEGNIANAENFMALPALAASFLIVSHFQSQKKSFSVPLFFFSGLLLGLSFLIKIVAVFDFGALFLFMCFISFDHLKKLDKRSLLSLVSISIGFALPIVSSLLFFAFVGALSIYIHSAFLNNVGYVNYGNQLILPFTHSAIPQGYLLVKLFLLIFLVGFLFYKRKVLSLTQVFIFLWLAFSIFNALFSQRPYTHYLLVLLPSFCLFVGLLMTHTKARVVLVTLGIILFFFLVKNFWLYSKTFGYYANFVSYLSGKESITLYQSFFDRVVPRDYALSQFILNHTTDSDTIFLWGNSGQIYRLSNKLPPERFIVAYHITSTPQTLLETSQALMQQKPKFVIILPNSSPFPYIMGNYAEREEIDGGIIYEKVL